MANLMNIVLGDNAIMFSIYNGRGNFWQWDLNQKLILQSPCQVHFCNGTSDCSIVVDSYEQDGMHLANVPNILMQTAGNLTVFAYILDNDEKYTKVSAVYKVHKRTRPADYVYTETDVMTWQNVTAQAIAEMRQLAESGALDGPAGADGRDGAQGPAGPKGDKGDKGQKGDTGATGPAGKTPVRGTDYWTEADKAAIVQDVLSSLPSAEGVGY